MLLGHSLEAIAKGVGPSRLAWQAATARLPSLPVPLAPPGSRGIRIVRRNLEPPKRPARNGDEDAGSTTRATDSQPPKVTPTTSPSAKAKAAAVAAAAAKPPRPPPPSPSPSSPPPPPPPSLTNRTGPLSSAADVEIAKQAEQIRTAPKHVQRGNNPPRAQVDEDDDGNSTPYLFSPRERNAGDTPQFPKIELPATPALQVPLPALRASPSGTVTFDSTQSLYASATSWDPSEDLGIYGNDVTTLSRIREDFFLKPRRYVALLMDADNIKFNLDLVRMGHDGGRIFHARLVERARRHLQLNHQSTEAFSSTLNRDQRYTRFDVPEDSSPRDHNISFRLMAFARIQGLRAFLFSAHDIPNEAFDAFRNGLNSASPWSTLIDAGNTPQAADNKLKVHMLDMLADSDCVHLYLAGLGDYGYADELDVLRRSKSLNRVSLVFLPGPALKSKYYEQFAARVVQWTDCFDDDYTTNVKEKDARKQKRADDDESAHNIKDKDSATDAAAHRRARTTDGPSGVLAGTSVTPAAPASPRRFLDSIAERERSRESTSAKEDDQLVRDRDGHSTSARAGSASDQTSPPSAAASFSDGVIFEAQRAARSYVKNEVRANREAKRERRVARRERRSEAEKRQSMRGGARKAVSTPISNIVRQQPPSRQARWGEGDDGGKSEGRGARRGEGGGRGRQVDRGQSSSRGSERWG